MPGCAYLPVTKSVVICAGESYSSNDFCNAIFLHTWSVSAADLVLNISYASQGSVVVDVWHELPSGAPQCVDSCVLPACAEGETTSMRIVLPAELQHITRGYCYFRVIALEAACTISGVSWSSLQPLRRSPKLALIITHFRREAEVQAFVASIRGTAIAEMLSQDKLALIIVDNSQTLSFTDCELDGFLVIPNANYGGSGGFARGMLEAERLGCSHCLLLDDDASLGEEGILRIWSRHAMADDDIAISAILLQSEDPLVIIEAAARYDGFCRPIAGNANITDFGSLKWLWTPPPHADYGAWCGFSFPFAGLRYYPFPFFVRGDDVLMPILNHMRIRTINGVTSLVPRFARKEGPLQAMLGTRCEMVLRSAVLQMHPLQAAAYFAKIFLNDLLSYRYGHCLARHAALSMYANAETAFTLDMNGSKVREQAREFGRYWPPSPQWRDQFDERISRTKRPPRPIFDAFIKLLFAITLNGHLIPFARLFQRHVYVSNLEMRISFKDAFLASKIVYYDHQSVSTDEDQTRICSFNQRVGLLCFYYLCVDVLSILTFGNSWSRRAARIARSLSTADFWKGIYGL